MQSLKVYFVGVVVQLVRTPACHAGGREFESRRPRHFPLVGAVRNCQPLEMDS
jgi:hypothetical protein